MRRSSLPECSRALMQASIMACAISSMLSEAMPSSRARLLAARAAAISMSGTIGSVSSICRSAVAFIRRASFSPAMGLEGEEQAYGGLDPLRDAAEAVERHQRQRVEREHRGQHVVGRYGGLEL